MTGEGTASLGSMTGFARAIGQDDAGAWTWEIKSVNGRGLDVRCRLPSGWDALEPVARAAVSSRFKRGNLNLSLVLDRAAAQRGYQLNRPLLQQILGLRTELRGWVADDLPRLDGLLAVPGVIEPTIEEADEAARESRLAAIAVTLDTALDQLERTRRQEGEAIAVFLSERLNGIEALVTEAEQCEAAQPEAIRVRLRELLRELLEAKPSLSEERIAQEAALRVGKADIREELERLRVHIGAAREHLREGGAVGRRLDFLCQELNREANTLCSKSASVELTRVGLALKAVIEQLREQIQNVE